MLVLSMHEESLYAERALRAGARGYIMKRAGGERVIEAIREVFQGRIAVSPAMATHLLEEYAGRRSHSPRVPLPNLTDREFQVLQLIGEVKTNREMAVQLRLSQKTRGNPPHESDAQAQAQECQRVAPLCPAIRRERCLGPLGRLTISHRLTPPDPEELTWAVPATTTAPIPTKHTRLRQ